MGLSILVRKPVVYSYRGQAFAESLDQVSTHSCSDSGPLLHTDPLLRPAVSLHSLLV